MKVNGTGTTNMQAGMFSPAGAGDTVSKSLQSQIASAQKQLQELSSNDRMSVEEKRKKRQELQKQIADWNNQLRQHQIEERKKKQQEQEQKKANTDTRQKQNTTQGAGNGLSGESMQAMIGADVSVKQAKIQSSTAGRLEGKARVLETEAKNSSDEAVVEQKQGEAASLQAQAQTAVQNQMDTLSKAKNNLEKAVATDMADKEDKTNTEDEVDKIAEGGEGETKQQSSGPQSESNSNSNRYTPVDVRI